MDKEKDAANRCSERRILCVNYIQLKEIKIQQKKFLKIQPILIPELCFMQFRNVKVAAENVWNRFRVWHHLWQILQKDVLL